ncbi:MAG: hypothetical protein M1815_000216 [Lichina confinis]|nr:MAG: hypothetical protein M1815_000216 [Lichina confinis]
MEELEARHKKEQTDLQSRTTQKMKTATKKTRKKVQAECEALERDLNERHTREKSELSRQSSQAKPDNERSSVEAGTSLETGTSESHAKIDPGDSVEVVPASQSSDGPGHVRKPNRQKARLARRAAAVEAQATEAAEQAATMPDVRGQERNRIAAALEMHGLEEKDIRPDGHCLYAAFADQLATIGITLPAADAGLPVSSASDVGYETPDFRMVRRATAVHIRKSADHFAPFIEESVEQYARKVAETAEWGGHLELMALAQICGVKIKVVQGDGRIEIIEPLDQERSPDVQSVWLAYYRHHYGLGEHYNSLRPATGGSQPESLRSER